MSEGLDPQYERAVPKDQRPVNELANLKKALLYSWATLPTPEYTTKLVSVFAFFFALVGSPIAYQTFDPTAQTAEFVLSAMTGSLLVVAVVVLRLYLGWSYVGERLLSASVEYEETGWYDGQVFVKPPEVLTRDRLLGMYEVKPALARLRTTLLASGAALTLSAVLLFGLIRAGADGDGVYGRGAARPPRALTSEGLPVYSSRVQELSQLVDDDELAAEEAAAQGGVPGYCGDRFTRAFAGGQYCDKFDRR